MKILKTIALITAFSMPTVSIPTVTVSEIIDWTVAISALGIVVSGFPLLKDAHKYPTFDKCKLEFYERLGNYTFFVGIILIGVTITNWLDYKRLSNQ